MPPVSQRTGKSAKADHPSTRATRNPPDFSEGLPANTEAEKMVLACILEGQLAFYAVRQELAASDFADPKHRKIWERMDDLWAARQDIDRVTLSHELDRHKELKDGLGGYVSELGADSPELVHPESYVAIVKEKAVRRLVINRSDALAKRALIETEKIEEVIASGVEFYREIQVEIDPKRDAPPAIPAWPDALGAAAYHGVAGDLVRLIEPHTEADSAALLLQFLVAWGSLAGRGPYYAVEADRHHTNEYVVIVGTTAKGRKGTSWGHIRAILAAIDEHWAANRLLYGLGSGEALIDAANDADKRTMLLESEFARLLAIVNREGSTISHHLRNGWDHGTLSVETRQNKVRVHGAHLSVVGHITREELIRRLSDIEIGNGFANRVMWGCARRSKMLPQGGGSTGDSSAILRTLQEATRKARQLADTRIKFDQEAASLWDQVYADLSEGRPGLFGAVTSRAEAHVVRLSLIYALLDGRQEIRLAHLRAALAVWNYSVASARYIWGDALGDPSADEMLRALKASTDGLTRWDISNHFGRNKSATEIDRALNVLAERGLIRSAREETGERGRTGTRYWAV